MFINKLKLPVKLPVVTVILEATKEMGGLGAGQSRTPQAGQTGGAALEDEQEAGQSFRVYQ